jgi:hypothetical protein
VVGGGAMGEGGGLLEAIKQTVVVEGGGLLEAIKQTVVVVGSAVGIRSC